MRPTAALLPIFCFLVAGACSAQAQYVSGGAPSSAVLKACNIANAIPVLSQSTSSTSCGASTRATGQFAGGVWVAGINQDASIATGSHWISSVTYFAPQNPGTSALYQINFKVNFINVPVCLAKEEGYQSSVEEPTEAIDSAQTIRTTGSGTAVPIRLNSGIASNARLFNLMCFVGQ